MRRLVAVLVLAATFGCGSDSSRPGLPFLRDTPEAPPPESTVVLPQYPQETNLLEFEAGPRGSHRYFIDKQSLAVGTDGVVRYSVIVRAAGGAVNTTYEGIRCSTGRKRLYAVGRGDKWVEAKHSQWAEIRLRSPNEYQATLYVDYFCPGRLIVPNREEALRVLLRSGSRGPMYIE